MISRKNWEWLAAMAIAVLMIVTGMWTFYHFRGDEPVGNVAIALVSIAAGVLSSIVATGALTLIRAFSTKDEDQRDRGVEGRIDAAEKRMRELIDARLKDVAQEKLDVDPTLRKLLNQRIDAGVISAVDEILRDRIRGEARILRTLEFMESVTLELKTRLEGPGRRAERDAAYARVGAYAMAVIGLAVAGYRVYSLGDISGRLMALATAVGDKPLWPLIAAQAAPYIGFVLLAEFTALLFLRFSNQSIALQRYFTEGLAQLRDRHLAMRFIVEFGSPEAIVSAAQKMIVASHRELQFLDDAKGDSSLMAKAAASLREKAASPRRAKVPSKPSVVAESV